MRKKGNVLRFFVVVISISLIITFIFQYTFLQQRRLKRNHILYSGTVTGVFWARGMNGGSCTFKYNFHDKDYSGSVRILTSRKNAVFLNCLLVGREFPIVLEKEKPSNSFMLLSKNDFKLYGYIINDTLKSTINILDTLTKFDFQVDNPISACAEIKSTNVKAKMNINY